MNVDCLNSLSAQADIFSVLQQENQKMLVSKVNRVQSEFLCQTYVRVCDTGLVL
jgi:hypothetical protein